MTAGPATRAVIEALRKAPALSGDIAQRVATVAQRAEGPFVVALAGRVKAGKSTLANALLARVVAATDVAECTKLVTRFCYGDEDRAVAMTRAGARLPLELDPVTGIPSTLPVATDDIDHLEVQLPAQVLRDLELVDTPGLQTVREENAERTEAFLGLDPDSAAACAEADAVVFLVNRAVRADDAEALRRFLTTCGDRIGLATVGVLNKADEIGAPDAARALAARHAAILRGLATTVVPLNGLVAATVRCGLFTDDDFTALAAVAALDDRQRVVLLQDVDLFVSWDVEISSERRAHLVSVLGLAGIRLAVDALCDGCDEHDAVAERLAAFSGLQLLVDAISQIRRRADAIKAQSSIAALERIAWAPTTPIADAQPLRDLVASLRICPELRVLDELAILEEAVSGLVEFREDEIIEMDRVFTASPASERLGVPLDTSRDRVSELAWDRAVHWRTEANLPADPRRRHGAGVVSRSYLLLWEELTGASIARS